MDGLNLTMDKAAQERSARMQAAINDLLMNYTDLKAEPRNSRGECRRTTQAQRANNLPGFYVIYRWGHATHELHVHYKKSGKINPHEVKVSGQNMQGGQTRLSAQQIALIKGAIDKPPTC